MILEYINSTVVVHELVPGVLCPAVPGVVLAKDVVAPVGGAQAVGGRQDVPGESIHSAHDFRAGKFTEPTLDLVWFQCS